MQFGTAPLGAHGRFGRDDTVLRVSTSVGSPGVERAGFLPFAGRSVLVCATLAAGIATAIIGLNGDLEGVPVAHAAVKEPSPTTDDLPPMPRPRIALAPGLPREEALTTASLRASPALAVPEADHGRIDRVPMDYWLADEPAQAVEEAAAILEFGPMRVSRQLVDVIMKAARATEMDPSLMMAIADKESSFLPHVQARTSSATGLFQFIERTWFGVVRDFGAKHGLAKEAQAITVVDEVPTVVDPAERNRILELRRDPYLAALFAAEMLKRDAARIGRAIGRELTKGEIYLAHFLGPDDAERFLDKVVNQPKVAAAKLLPKPARANRPIFFVRKGRKAKSLSVAEVHGKFEAMMNRRLERYRDVSQVAGIASEPLTRVD